MNESYLALNVCPHGLRCIALGSGLTESRITPMKCCGRWEEIERWPLTAERLRELSALFAAEAKEGDDE